MKTGRQRFYQTVQVRSESGGFGILLDGKSVRTPASELLISPTLALASGIADEWRAQGHLIDLGSMQLTKALNTAIDRVAGRRHDVIEELARFGASDVLCYRAQAPAELVRRQSAAWDPWLKWASEHFGAELAVVTGINHQAQSPDAMARIFSAIAAHDDFRLTALYIGTTIFGSAVLGLAFVKGVLSAEEGLRVSLVDEAFQIEQWGSDVEAEVVRARRLDELRSARRYLDLLCE